MGRRTVLAVAALVALAVVGPSVVAGADPEDARLTLTDVAVAPATPTVGEPVEFDVTLRNSAGSTSPIAVESVVLRSGEEDLVEATDLGTLSAGDTLTIPLSTTFDSAGAKNLELVAVGTDANGNRVNVTRPVSVAIERAPPQLDVRVDSPVAGAASTVTVTVSNPTEAQVRNLTLSAGGEVVPVDGAETIPALAAGGSETVNLTVRPTGPGETTLRVGLGYTTAAGTPDRTQLTRTVQTAPLEDDVGVSVTPVQQAQQQQVPTNVQSLLTGGTSGATTQQDQGEDRPSRVSVTVTNFGNAPVADLVVVPRAGDGPLPRRAVPGPLEPGESTSVTVDLSTVRRPGDVTFEVTYGVGRETGTATGTYEYRPKTGTMRLTGISMAFEDGQLVLQGNAGNVGRADVQGVVVSVGDTEYVDPAYPNRNYFVGTVEGSEFVPFELTADVDAGNVSTVPVTVAYRVDGYEFSRTVDVPYDDTLDPDPDAGGGGFPAWLVGLGAILAVVGVAAGLAYYRRREE